MHTIRFGVTTDDSERWTGDQLARYEDDDAVIEALCEVMRETGDEFIRQNPELFRSSMLA